MDETTTADRSAATRRCWDRASLIERIQTWAAQHDGHGPRRDDWRTAGHPDWELHVWPGIATVLEHFDAWDDALAAAGVTRRPRRKRAPRADGWNRELLIERIRTWAREHDGYAPRRDDWGPAGHPDWQRGAWPSASDVGHHFESWTAALAAAGVGPRPRPKAEPRADDSNREPLIERIQTWARLHGGYGPRSTDWCPGGHPCWRPGTWPSRAAIEQEFGGWGEALAAAGVEPRPRQQTPDAWSRDAIVERLQAWAAEHQGWGPRSTDWGVGGAPDWEPHVWPERGVVTDHFPSWADALAAAGVEPRPRRETETGLQWSQGSIVTHILEWARAHDGYGPLGPDWSPCHPDWSAGRWPSGTAVRTHWGTFEAANAAAGVPTRPPRKATWTRDLIVEHLKAWALAHDGYGPRTTDWQPGGHPDWVAIEWPTCGAVLDHFGGHWDEALRAAGLEPRPKVPS